MTGVHLFISNFSFLLHPTSAKRRKKEEKLDDDFSFQSENVTAHCCHTFFVHPPCRHIAFHWFDERGPLWGVGGHTTPKPTQNLRPDKRCFFVVCNLSDLRRLVFVYWRFFHSSPTTIFWHQRKANSRRDNRLTKPIKNRSTTQSTI